MRALALAVAAGLVAVGITPAWACACGGYFPDAGAQARAAGENALVRYVAGREEIVLSMAIHGESKKAAWIMPVPGEADVDLGPENLFGRLTRITRPRQERRRTYWPFRDLGLSRGDGAAGAPQAPGGGVEVRGQMTIGPFKVARLGGTSAAAVTGWLSANGYTVPGSLAANLTPYLAEKWEIVAVTLAPGQSGSTLRGATPPLRLRFASDRIVYPMRLSRGATTAQTVTVYVAGEHRVDATGLPDPAIRPELLFAGRVTDDALIAPADYLTAYSVRYDEPSRITGDFVFTRAASDDEYQRVEVVTTNDGRWSTLAIVLALVVAGVALVIVRGRRLSTGADR